MRRDYSKNLYTYTTRINYKRKFSAARLSRKVARRLPVTRRAGRPFRAENRSTDGRGKRPDKKTS